MKGTSLHKGILKVFKSIIVIVIVVLISIRMKLVFLET